MLLNKFTWNECGDIENWRHETFNTIEECFKDAIENYDLKKGSEIFIGECKPYKVKIDGSIFLESLENDAINSAGECAEDWINYNNKMDISYLESKLEEVVNNWLVETQQTPNFYSIENDKKYIITGEN